MGFYSHTPKPSKSRITASPLISCRRAYISTQNDTNKISSCVGFMPIVYHILREGEGVAFNADLARFTQLGDGTVKCRAVNAKIFRKFAVLELRGRG